MNTDPPGPGSPGSFWNQLTPWEGRLKVLRTRAEVQASHDTINVHLVAIPVKAASSILKSFVRQCVPNIESCDIQHLRRVVAFDYLPSHLKAKFHPQDALPESTNDPNFTTTDTSSASGTSFWSDARFLLFAPTSMISYEDLTSALSQESPFLEGTYPLRIETIVVPKYAPVSGEQAALWTSQYWPISYKNTNPYGPHPSLVERAQSGIESKAGLWLALAEHAAIRAAEQNLGQGVGCVIVETSSDGTAIPIAVAGDGRWCNHPSPSKDTPGNVMAHAVMRAIGMVARKRIRVAKSTAKRQHDSQPDLESETLPNDILLDHPLTDIERDVFDAHDIVPNGYLCADLDIYITHEPCIMCAMAILHSRFNRCIFGQRMPLSGGLTAEPRTDTDSVLPNSSLGQGIFWRPAELNWRYLTWEWLEEEEDENSRLGGVDLSVNA